MRHIPMGRLAAVCAAASLIVTACSSSGGGGTDATNSSANSGAATSASTSACSTQAQSAITAAQQIPTVAIPSLSNGQALKGKLLALVPETLSVADDGVWVKGVKAAASAVGAKVQVIDGGGTPTGETKAFQEAQSLHPAAVLSFGVVTGNVSGAVSSLASAKIPLVAYAPGIPTTAKYIIDADWPAVGKLEADYALSQTGCKADVAIFTSSIFTNITAEVTAAQAELKRLCSSCKSTVINVDLASLATKVQPETVQTLRRDPSINYIIAAFDALATYIVPGVQESGNSVKLIGNTGTDQNVGFVEKGTVQVADIEAVEPTEVGWMSVDDALRAAAGTDPSPSSAALPRLLITKSNLSPSKTYLADTSYVQKFKSAWGVSG